MASLILGLNELAAAQRIQFGTAHGAQVLADWMIRANGLNTKVTVVRDENAGWGKITRGNVIRLPQKMLWSPQVYFVVGHEIGHIYNRGMGPAVELKCDQFAMKLMRGIARGHMGPSVSRWIRLNWGRHNVRPACCLSGKPETHPAPGIRAKVFGG